MDLSALKKTTNQAFRIGELEARIRILKAEIAAQKATLNIPEPKTNEELGIFIEEMRGMLEQFEGYDECEFCFGEGVLDEPGVDDCPNCEGRGFIRHNLVGG